MCPFVCLFVGMCIGVQSVSGLFYHLFCMYINLNDLELFLIFLSTVTLFSKLGSLTSPRGCSHSQVGFRAAYI